MPDTNLSFAKIVATPTTSSWSQAYNAGSLFVVLSLTGEVSDEDASLNSVGKDFLNNLEAEFFGLEEKSLQSIKQAITDSCQKIPDALSLSLSLVFIKQNIVYAYCMEQGRVLMRREGKIGSVLTQPTQHTRDIATSSGFLQNKDTLLLATKQFASAVPKDTLYQALELDIPNDIAETLSLPIHGIEEGGAASIIITFQGSSQHFMLENQEEETEEFVETPTLSLPTDPLIAQDSLVQVDEQKPTSNFFKTKLLPLINKFTAKLPHSPIHLSHRKKLMISVAIILLITLGVSIFMKTKQQKSSQEIELFTKVYQSAKKDYDEGEGLLSLNKNLARDDFLAAQKKLIAVKDSFKPGSNEAAQIKELLQKTEQQLQGASGIQQIALKEIPGTTSKLLSYTAEHAGTIVAEDSSFLYAVSDKAITRIDKGNDQAKSIVTNDSDWTTVKGVGFYLGNIYVLDSKNAVLKYVASGSSYEKGSYFPKDGTPDTSKAVSMTIDGSIWILFADGTIEKFTKGKADSFTASGLDKPFNNPSRIYTNEDITTLYILDNGNSRIVKLNKDGTYQAQYVGQELKTATTFIINEKDKKATILSNGKLYELGL